MSLVTSLDRNQPARDIPTKLAKLQNNRKKKKVALTLLVPFFRLAILFVTSMHRRQCDDEVREVAKTFLRNHNSIVADKERKF